MLDMEEYLDTKLLHEKEPVTYRLLTRQFRIPVNTAKQVLQDYANAHQQIHATYCLIGTEKASDSNQLVIRMAKSNELESVKQTFKHISGTQVYSLCPYDPKDLSVIIAADENLPKLTAEDRTKCGLLQNTRLVNKSSVKQESRPTHSISVPKETPAPTPTPVPAPKATPAKATPAKATPNTFGAFLKTSNASTSSKRKSSESEEPKSKNHHISKKIKDSSKPIIPAVASEEEESDEELDRRLARSNLNANVFTDEEDDIFDDDIPTETKTYTDSNETPGSDKSAKDEDVAMADNPIDVDSVKEIPEKTKENELETKDGSTTSSTPGKIRRKVQKKKTYVNERGFRVTENVWEWEEVDADTASDTPATVPIFSNLNNTAKKTIAQTENTPKPKAAPAAKKGAKKGAASAGQANLLSFFGKK
ncbi:DNA polymerase subunit Cdc27 [Phycomyces blakesleeanus]